MREATTTVEIDERGRVTIPQPVRKRLGIEGESAAVEITVKYDD